MRYSIKLLCVLVTAVFVFVACEDDVCTTCQWDDWIQEGSVTETTDSKEKRNCTVCGATETRIKDYATGTAGLEYELIDTNAFSVRKGTVTSGVVNIPAFRLNNGEYQPVTEVGAATDGLTFGAFFNVQAITDVVFLAPSNIKSIGGSAFRQCNSLESVTIPGSVTSIASAAFFSMSSLTSVTVLAATPPVLSGTSVFDNNHANRKIYVPAGSVATYKAATGWDEYADAIQAIP